MRAGEEHSRADRIAAVRAFNRFYTRQIGLLEDGLLRSGFSLAEARVLFELAHRDAPTATEIGESLGLDPGYLSRMITSFVKQGLVAKSPAAHDRRQHRLGLTQKGSRAFAQLDRRSQTAIGALLDGLSHDGQERIVKAMDSIESLMRTPAREERALVLRPHRPGDMGYVVGRHGALYAAEYGWDESFEALAAEIAAQFLRTYDERRERCFIAEIDGEPVGSAFLVCASETVAKLRLLLVEPQARGLGVGRALVEACIGFARQKGYASITLWTQSTLTAARAIYARAGFRLVREEPHVSFGKKLVGETWEMEL